jgi:hypothetical protein
MGQDAASLSKDRVFSCPPRFSRLWSMGFGKGEPKKITVSPDMLPYLFKQVKRWHEPWDLPHGQKLRREYGKRSLAVFFVKAYGLSTIHGFGKLGKRKGPPVFIQGNITQNPITENSKAIGEVPQGLQMLACGEGPYELYTGKENL